MRSLGIIFCVLLLFLITCAQPKEGTAVEFRKKTFIYKSIDKVTIKADLFQNAGDSRLKPVIVWIHGGGLIFGSRTDIPEEQLKLYLNAGFSLVSIDYRLAPETKLPRIIEDMSEAIQWIRVNGRDSLGIDSAKIFVIGHSGGAYLALMSGSLKNPPAGIVSFYGYGDIVGDWYSKPDSFYLTRNLVSERDAKKLIHDSVITSAPFESRFDLYVYSRQNGNWPALVGGHNPVEESKWFEQYCPIKNIRANHPPVLLIHGDKDTDVPFEQSVLMDKELTSKNIEHKFIRMPNFGHVFDLFEGGLSNPKVSTVFAEVIDFMNSKR